MPTFALVDLATQAHYPLLAEDIVVGSASSAQIILHDPHCSSVQFRLRADPSGYLLEPLPSEFPTWLEGHEVKHPVRLFVGAVLQVGEVRLRYESLTLIPESTGNTGMRTILGDPNSLGSTTTEEPILLPDGEAIIGRDPDCTIRLKHPQVSRMHARLHVSSNETTIQDLGSANGTFVNGRRLARYRPQKLSPGDQLNIGPFGLTFDIGQLLPRSRVNNVELVASAVSRVVTDRGSGKPLKLLDEISLVVRPREFVCLLGPSGSGKTTLMGILSGRVRPESGAVLVNGQNLHANFEALKKDLAYVPQKDVMHDKLTIGEALNFTGFLRLPPDLSKEERTAGINSILETVSLTQRRNTRICHLSGGQIKRASLANEILCQPSLLFLDEVTSGLDEQTDYEMMKLFRHVADEGKTVVCITHNLANVELNCDLVVILTAGGKTAFIGSPAEAREHFHVNRLGEVYAKLAEHPAEVWQKRFRESAYFKKYVESRLQAVRPQPSQGHAPPQALKQAKTTVRQSILLTLRYLFIWKNSPATLLSLFGQTLLVAMLLIFVFGHVGEPAGMAEGSEFTEKIASSVEFVEKVHRAENLLFLLAVSAFWLGCNNAAKELVKERTIFHRERDYNLLTGSYLASKWFVLCGIGALQVSLLQCLVGHFCEPPGNFWWQWAVLLLLSGAGTSLGLLLSAIASSEEVAIALIPVAVIPQIILSGAIAPLSGGTHWVAKCGVTCYWGKRALDSLLPERMATVAQWMKFAEPGEFFQGIGFLALHTVGTILLAFLVLRSRRS